MQHFPISSPPLFPLSSGPLRLAPLLALMKQPLAPRERNVPARPRARPPAPNGIAHEQQKGKRADWGRNVPKVRVAELEGVEGASEVHSWRWVRF